MLFANSYPVLRKRYDVLEAERAASTAWREFAGDIIDAFITLQREIVAMHRAAAQRQQEGSDAFEHADEVALAEQAAGALHALRSLLFSVRSKLFETEAIEADKNSRH